MRALLRSGKTVCTDENLRRENVRAEMKVVVDALAAEPVLRHPDYDKPFVLKCDGSVHGLPFNLCQKDEEGNLHPVEYNSKSIPPTKRDRSQPQLGVLAVLHGLRKYRQILQQRKSILISVHTNLPILLARP